MNGTTKLQQEAALKRSKRILKNRYKEPNFQYMGDTVVIFDLQQALRDNKDDLLRKSMKRTARRSTKTETPALRNSTKRFRAIMEELYQKSLQQQQK